MMAGNPNWWSMNSMHPQMSSQFSLSACPSEADHHQDLPLRSWSQLLLGRFSGVTTEEETRFGGGVFHQKKFENWEEHVLNLNTSFTRDCAADIKQETRSCQQYSDNLEYDDHFQIDMPSNSWANQLVPVSSPTPCVSSLRSKEFNFSASKAALGKNCQHRQSHSSECNSIGSGGAPKKARVHQSSVQPAMKHMQVRKEKLGGRITALHQIVSPFGKTDTATVLSEAFGYIRFLQAQIQALSSPYMRNASATPAPHSQVQEMNCLFGDEISQGVQSTKDLRSRGLCLVPISFIQQAGDDSGVDYWAPPTTLKGGF